MKLDFNTPGSYWYLNISVSTSFAIQKKKKILNVGIKIIWDSQMIELVTA